MTKSKEIIKYKLLLRKILSRNRKSKNDIQYNGQQKKDKRTNKDPQNITENTRYSATRTQKRNRSELNRNRSELMCFGRVNSS